MSPLLGSFPHKGTCPIAQKYIAYPEATNFLQQTNQFAVKDHMHSHLLSKVLVETELLENLIGHSLLLWNMNEKEIRNIKFPVGSSLSQVK